LTTKIHALATSDRAAFAISLTGGQAGDCPHGKELLVKVGQRITEADLLVDKAYPSLGFRQFAEILGYNIVSPPPRNLKEPWEYDKEKYKLRNEIERLFLRIKRRFRRVYTRYDKLAVVYMGFVLFALIMETLRVSVNTS